MMAPGSLVASLCWAKFPSPSTTWQIFRKIAGMPQDIKEQAYPQALQWVSPQRACASHLPSVAWRMEEPIDLSSAR
jgi:hypothetical protein